MGFDKTAYQREYMRKRREAQKAGNPQKPKSADVAYMEARLAALDSENGKLREAAARVSMLEARIQEMESGRQIGILSDHEIAWDSVPKSAQEKIESFRRKIRKELETEFNERLGEAVKDWVERHLIPQWREKIAFAEKYNTPSRAAQFPFNKDEFRKILLCLHPDKITALGISDAGTLGKYAEAFDLFKSKEDRLVVPQAPKSDAPPIPATFAELVKMRRTKTI